MLRNELRERYIISSEEWSLKEGPEYTFFPDAPSDSASFLESTMFFSKKIN